MPTTWGQGDYALMAERLTEAARRAVALAEVTRDDHVLDVACGTGNAALLAAVTGARVEGVDIEPGLLTIAAARARESGLSVAWHRGDAERLDVDDGEFDAVVSVFGVMYAGDQDAAARELARAVASDGRVVLASWTPGSFMSQLGGVFAPYLPAPSPSSAAPSRWGDAEALTVLLGDAGLTVDRAAPHQLTLSFDNRTTATDFLVRTAGHVVDRRLALRSEGRWSDLLADLGVFVGERDNGVNGVALQCEYLLALARRA